MKKFAILLAGLGVATAAVPAIANAQPMPQRHWDNGGGWQNINERQGNLYQRIDMGVRNGSLTRREADRLRYDFRALNNLEANYRRGGLNQWERNDLNRRFDALSARIRYDKHDGDNRWDNRGPGRGPDHGPDRGPDRRW